MDYSSFSGKVVKGRGYGRKIGFPTANIDRRSFVRLVKKPKEGIYAGHVAFTSGIEHPAAIVIGPKDVKGLPHLEAHILGFTGNLYGKQLVFLPKKFIRAFKKYPTEKALITAIEIDIKKIKSILNK